MPSLRRFYLFVTTTCLTAMFLPAPAALAASAPLYLSFTVPQSTATYPLSINRDLTVTGYYVDASGNTHGFVRCLDGKITTFDVPGSLLTKPVSINAAGEITGYYEVESGEGLVTLGFTRDRSGVISTFGDDSTSFDAFLPQPVAINHSGEVVGNFPSAGLGSEAFVLSPAGTLQTFSITIGAAYSTILTGVNAEGAVVGYGGSDDIAAAQGLLWNGQAPLPSPGSGYTAITYPGSTGTFPTGINSQGEIVGCYSIGTVFYDFMRASDGTFTTLSPSGTVPSCTATFDTNPEGLYDVLPASVSLNNNGTVIGYTTNAGLTSGFVRFSGGRIVPLVIPGSTLTLPSSINNLGVLTGYYTKGSATKGFIALP